MSLRKRLTLPLVIFCFLAGTGHVFAQAQVVDAASDQSRSNQNPGNTQPAAGNNSQNDIMVEMYLQLEALQNEIQNLRGMVEEQSYVIQRLQTEQRDRYLDTDSRLSELFSYHSGQQPPARQPSTGTPNEQPAATGGPGSLLPGSPLNTAGNDIGTTTTASTAPRNEQELYRDALDLLLEEENFQESVNLFQQYIDNYPQGRYLTNALYWQGAALHLLGNLPQSIAVLQRLLDEFPQDPKAPTAMLRLGTVYSEMGNRSRAVEYWSRISQAYPGSTSEIELASDYLNAAGP